jgi:hypothetical protein
MFPEDSSMARGMKDKAYRDSQWELRYTGRVAAINRSLTNWDA